MVLLKTQGKKTQRESFLNKTTPAQLSACPMEALFRRLQMPTLLELQQPTVRRTSFLAESTSNSLLPTRSRATKSSSSLAT